MKTLPILALAALFVFSLSLDTAIGQSEKIVPEMKIAGHRVICLNHISGIEPATATVQKGTTVIWTNDSRSLVEIEFTGKQVTLACQNPVHFVVNEAGSFISNKIPQGAVASLCFVEKGEYRYAVRREPGRTAPQEALKEYTGTIIVQ